MPEDLTERQLKFGYWFLIHRELLKKILIVILILVNAGVWGYSITAFIFYFVQTPAHQAQMKLLSQDLVNYQLRYKFGPQKLVYSSPQFILAGKDPAEPALSKYDFAIEVENLNSNWLARGQFKFIWSEDQIKSSRFFVLPGQKKHFLILGEKLANKPSDIQIELEQINWKRLKGPSLEKLASLDIAVENVKFVPKTIAPARVDFQATNNTVYNFWQARFNIILFQGKNIVGLASSSIEQFLSGQTREISATWLELNLAAVTRVVVEPEIDILDPDVIMPLR